MASTHDRIEKGEAIGMDGSVSGDERVDGLADARGGCESGVDGASGFV